MDHHHQPPLNIQIPSFVYNSTPVPGGGAELINAHWFAANAHPPFVADQNEEQQPEYESTGNPFDYPPEPYFPAPPPPQQQHQVQHVPTPDLSVFLAAPSPLGLPVYSASGFDILSLLARIVTRPRPRIVLGPVDLTCSFVVVDTRHYDHPIVYCSPEFCRLTGYEEREVLGRNCRFLQAPGGRVAKGDKRLATSGEAVEHLRRSLAGGKECQTSIVNYRKGGEAFVNLVTVIPVPETQANGEEGESVFQVGFQVDLTRQPNAILEKLRDGSYLVDYAQRAAVPPPPFVLQAQIQDAAVGMSARDRKASAIPAVVLSKELRRMLADPGFLRSVPITNTSTTAPPPATSTATATAATTTTSFAAGTADDALGGAANHPLSMILLELAPDFIHVVDLKGKFLYVAPSVRRVLGYEASEMLGKAIGDYAHPEDVVPLLRELKESSATGTTSGISGSHQDKGGGPNAMGMPRSVDLLFRAKTKMGRYVWVECRGRLLVEPGKGRKAIVLSGRAREMMGLRWEDVRRAGGIARGLRVPVDATTTTTNSNTKSSGAKETATKGRVYRDVEQEVWGTLGGKCKDTATFLSVGQGVRDVLGWTADELVGRGLDWVVKDEVDREVVGGFVKRMRRWQTRARQVEVEVEEADGERAMKMRCWLGQKGGEDQVDVWFVVYRADVDVQDQEERVEVGTQAGCSITPAPLVFQIRMADAEMMMPALERADAEVDVQALIQGALPGSTSTAASSTTSGSGASGSAQAATTTTMPTDIFEELSTKRGTSWQYELQQLRITNLRLKEELAALEAASDACPPGVEVATEVSSVPSSSTTGGGGEREGPLTTMERQGGYEVYEAPQQQQQQQQQQHQRGQENRRQQQDLPRLYTDVVASLPPLFTMEPQLSAPSALQHRRSDHPHTHTQNQDRQHQYHSYQNQNQQREQEMYGGMHYDYSYDLDAHDMSASMSPLSPEHPSAPPSGLMALLAASAATPPLLPPPPPPPPSLPPPPQSSPSSMMAMNVTSSVQVQQRRRQQKHQHQQHQQHQQNEYLHQPVPVVRYQHQLAQQQLAQSQHHQHQHQGIVPGPRPMRRGTPLDWSSGSMPPPPSSQQQQQGYGSGLKRAWGAMDAP
ncbi:hypothetical protein BDN70DRAFT_937187 [Pholiota conissans]|uniref:PAS domain-containing protein n=1 Tax=Pholiota conissans TaxID=109636 RepID=A0A9P5YQU2_9AGAR|nr:hypothetical protein BDN70DRAFT_937187 [Pholiota conissans]